MSDATIDLRARLARKPILIAPGVFDALTATIGTDAGFEALYVSGAAVSYTLLGRPDIGLATLSEMADVVRNIRERVETALIVDADTGHGNALNAQRTVRLFERAGANAVQLEDQSLPKRCGHLAGKTLVSAREMVGKIKAAVDARADARTLVIARTDAIAVEGFDAAEERAGLYAEAGADVLFVEAPQDRQQLARVGELLGRRVPLMANMVEGGRTPVLPAAELEGLGYSLVIFPGGVVRAMARAAREFYGVLRRDGTSDAFRDRMYDFDAVNALLGAKEILARGKRYDEGAD